MIVQVLDKRIIWCQRAGRDTSMGAVGLDQSHLAVVERARPEGGRDPALTESLLDRLEKTALGDENMMPIIIECVENKLTLGEICGRLRRVWGEYHAPNYI